MHIFKTLRSFKRIGIKLSVGMLIKNIQRTYNYEGGGAEGGRTDIWKKKKDENCDLPLLSI